MAAVTAFLVIDGIWLGIVARGFYANQMADLLRKNILAAPALAFYLMYTAGLVFLAVRPGQADVTLASVAFYGAVVGFLAYGTYNMTMGQATMLASPSLTLLCDVSSCRSV